MAEHARKIGSVQIIDIETGEVVEERQNAGTLLPPPPGVCPICAVDHPWNHPHDAQSLYYQMRFHGEHGRWPMWTDAMAHCTPELQAEWKRLAIETYKSHGLPVPDDLLTGPAAGR